MWPRLNFLLIGAVLLFVAFRPSPATRTVIVLAAPFGANVEAIVAQADGVLVKGGRGGAILAAGKDSSFVARLYAAGALLVLDGGALTGCGGA